MLRSPWLLIAQAAASPSNPHRVPGTGKSRLQHSQVHPHMKLKQLWFGASFLQLCELQWVLQMHFPILMEGQWALANSNLAALMIPA